MSDRTSIVQPGACVKPAKLVSRCTCGCCRGVGAGCDGGECHGCGGRGYTESDAQPRRLLKFLSQARTPQRLAALLEHHAAQAEKAEMRFREARLCTEADFHAIEGCLAGVVAAVLRDMQPRRPEPAAPAGFAAKLWSWFARRAA